jgi:1-aminocyclopropane-1-carboxylate deaminase
VFINSRVDLVSFCQRDIYIKRDDLLPPEFNGNKARKFAFFLENDFPGIHKLVSYGSPQANSLYSLSALARRKGWQLDYYVDHIAAQVSTNPMGNYAAALDNGANIIDLSALLPANDLSCHDYIERHILGTVGGTDGRRDEGILFVPEGGRCQYARYGLTHLAEEIHSWAQSRNLIGLRVFLPSGTGTTALFLQQALIELCSDIRVFTCAVVGGHDYLRAQFSELCLDRDVHPHILSLPKKYHFGKLYPEYFQMWQRLNETGIDFELLYDPLGFLTLEAHLPLFAAKPLMYLHQGGLLGNETMLPRYRRKYAAGKE